MAAWSVRRKRALRIGVGLAAAGAVFVLVWFQPQKLFYDTVVDETPIVTAPPSATVAVPAPTAPAPAVLSSGAFEPLEHPTSGRAVIIRRTDGEHIAQLEELRTSNGPDLVVYLSKLPAGLGWRDYGRDFVDLGKLKGNVGTQSYVIPTGVDLSSYRSVVIWCRRFSVGFGVAELRPAAS